MLMMSCVWNFMSSKSAKSIPTYLSYRWFVVLWFFYKRSAICHLWTRIHTVLYESWTLWECENVRKTHQRAHVLYLSTFFMFVQWLFQRHRLLLYFFHLMPTFTTSYLVPITSILPPFVSTPYSLSELVLRLRASLLCLYCQLGCTWSFFTN